LVPGSSSSTDAAGEGGEVVVEAVPFIKLFDVATEVETKSATRAAVTTEENPIVEAVWCDTVLRGCSLVMSASRRCRLAWRSPASAPRVVVLSHSKILNFGI
jgi:hypothetical protein